MDTALLLDICVRIATALCIALLLYGVWLCLPQIGGSKSKPSGQEGESEAVVRERRDLSPPRRGAA
jgi:hypothetical protein